MAEETYRVATISTAETGTVPVFGVQVISSADDLIPDEFTDGQLMYYFIWDADESPTFRHFYLCDTPPTFEVDSLYSALWEQEEEAEIERSPCEITAEYSRGLPIEVEESLWEALTTSCQAMYGGDYIQDPTSLASPRDPASATGTCLCVSGWSYTALDLPFEF